MSSGALLPSRKRPLSPTLQQSQLVQGSEQKCKRQSTHSPSATLDSEVFSDDDADEFGLWARSLFFSRDRTGKEQLLDVDGTQVMMEWEREYMERCVDRLGIDSDSHVLEIGYGCGYSSQRIQAAHPKSHTIVECAPAVLARLHAWAGEVGREGVLIVEGTWQECLPSLGIFDCIFLDDYGEPGPQPVAPFHDERYAKEYMCGETHFAASLGVLLRWHSKPGTCITGYLVRPVDLDRVDVQVSYERMAVAPPPHCNYYFSDTAVVPLFVKTDALEKQKDGRSSPSCCDSTRSSFRGHSCDRSTRRSASERSWSGSGADDEFVACELSEV